jgi:hypothetical protein
MYFQLTSAVKRRFIAELRRYWQYHPRFPDLPDNIQGKYRFKERPQYGMTVKMTSGSRVDLAADNYKGILESYVYLTKYQNYPGLAVEWVREDSVAIQNNEGHFPSPPGIYFIDLIEENEFFVDPLLDVYHEAVTMVDALTLRLSHAPVSGTIRLFEMPSGFMLTEGVNYTVERDPTGKPTGEITLTQPLTGGRWISSDYRYAGASTGPYTIYPMHANNQAIPGVVLAFGTRNGKGDRMAVVVQDRRLPACMVFGGQWDLGLEIEVTSRDLEAQMEIADSSAIYLWGILRSRLSSEGIEITDLSLGGETEEAYDENGDDYFYNASLTATVRTDWEVYVPLNVFLRQVSILTRTQAEILAGLSEDQLAAFQTNLHMVEQLGLEHIRDPFFSNRSHTFEEIR